MNNFLSYFDCHEMNNFFRNLRIEGVFLENLRRVMALDCHKMKNFLLYIDCHEMNNFFRNLRIEGVFFGEFKESYGFGLSQNEKFSFVL